MRRASSRILAGVALAAGLLAASLGGAADLKIGYIDSSKIFQEYTTAKEAQARFDRQVTSWREEAAEKEKSVNALRVEVRDQAPILSTLKRQEREEALQKAISDYEAFVQEIWGPSGRAAQENERMTSEVVSQIRTVVEKLAGDRGLDLVLDAAGGYIVYADRNLDLTAEVVRELNTRTGTPR
jgi:outer membrane protein